MKIEIEVKAFGEVDGNGDVYKSTELMKDVSNNGELFSFGSFKMVFRIFIEK